MTQRKIESRIKGKSFITQGRRKSTCALGIDIAQIYLISGVDRIVLIYIQPVYITRSDLIGAGSTRSTNQSNSIPTIGSIFRHFRIRLENRNLLKTVDITKRLSFL